MRLILGNYQNDCAVQLSKFRKVADIALNALKLRGQGTIEVSFVDDATIREINKQLLKHDYVTDVISIRYDDALQNKRISRCALGGSAGDEAIVGEIWIAPQVAKQYAIDHAEEYERELARYLIHGLLHWIGFDDHSAQELMRMRRREQCVLDQLQDIL